MKLPPQIVLAPDYIVHIKIIPWADINPPDSGDPTEGYWDKDDMTIYLANEVSEGEQLYTLLHEQVHAALDCMDFHLSSWKARAKQMPPRKRKLKLRSTYNPAVLVPASGVTAPLTVENAPVHAERVKDTDKKS